MKTIKLSVLALCLMLFTVNHAQTAEEIVSNYIENIGGIDAWSKMNTMKATGIGRQQGVDYPFVATYKKDGKTLVNIDLQGQQFTVEAFDGATEWSMNFQTQKAEAADSESSLNYKNEAKDNFPDAFMNYKDKGYKVELVGEEEFDGTQCFKIKLTKKPVLVDGQEENNIEFYFFDKDNFIPIAMESVISSGQAKGMTAQTLFSDYQEVDGLYMPYSVISKFNGQVGLEMIIKTVEFNIEVDDAIFKMPDDISPTGKQ